MDICLICKKHTRVKRNLRKIENLKNAAVLKLLNKLCADCSRTALQELGTQATDKSLKDFYAKVNGLLTSAEVRQIRKNLNLTQKAAAFLCGGGPNAFSRYERGEAVPIRATSNLLRLLDKYPQEISWLLDFSPSK